jgi:transmembrane protein EpsG
MIYIAIFNSVVILLASLTKSSKSLYGLKSSFLLIFLFLAFRYDYGNDYQSYLKGFIDLEYFDLSLKWEPGWQILNIIFKPLGFFAMTAFLAAINCYIYYNFIKKYVPPLYYWFAVFIYVFNPSFMLVHLSAMRQSIAITLFLVSIKYIYSKNIYMYLLCIALSSLFHFSALILLPVYYIVLYTPKINSSASVIVLLLLFFILFLFGNTFKLFLDQFISNYFGRYDYYKEGGSTLNSGLGFIYIILIFICILIYTRYQNNEILFKIAIISYYILPLSFLIMMIGRVGMYLEPVLIAVIPILFATMSDVRVKYIASFVFVFMTLYSFYYFFQVDGWGIAYSTYHTVFQAPKIF